MDETETKILNIVEIDRRRTRGKVNNLELEIEVLRQEIAELWDAVSILKGG